jgi:hypothetical protein
MLPTIEAVVSLVPDPGYAPRTARAAGVGEFAPDVGRRAGAGAAGTDGY